MYAVDGDMVPKYGGGKTANLDESISIGEVLDSDVPVSLLSVFT